MPRSSRKVPRSVQKCQEVINSAKKCLEMLRSAKKCLKGPASAGGLVGLFGLGGPSSQVDLGGLGG